MKTKLTRACRAILVCAVAILAGVSPADAQSTAFTYQGRLNDNGAPATGTYDLQFTIYDLDTGGGVVAGPITNRPVAVTNGLFTVTLDFGAGVFSGDPRWLEIGVTTNGGGSFATLSPLQALLPAPYAITAANVGSGAVVKSLNSLLDDVTLAAGSNVTITPIGNTLTIDSVGAGGSGIWNLNGTGTYFDTGNVGIGTAAPTTALEVEGIVRSSRIGNASQYLQLDGGDPVSIRMTAQSIAGAEKNLVIRNLTGEATPGANNTIQFAVGTAVSPSTKMTITKDGNVGIGTTTTTNKLEVAGNTRINGQINVNVGGTSNVTMRLQGRSGDDIPFEVYDSSGNSVFAFGTPTTPGLPPYLFMHGDAYKSYGGSSWIFTSDRRLKQEVRAYETGLKEILQLRAVRFRYRDDPKRGLTSTHEEVGFIAQEVREVIPDAVTEGQDGYLSLKADPIHWAAINAIQELNAKLEAQRAQNAALNQRLERIERLLNQKSEP